MGRRYREWWGRVMRLVSAYRGAEAQRFALESPPYGAEWPEVAQGGSTRLVSGSLPLGRTAPVLLPATSCLRRRRSWAKAVVQLAAVSRERSVTAVGAVVADGSVIGRLLVSA